MYQHYFTCPRHEISIDAEKGSGPLECWRHTLGHGGINRLPLPQRVVDGVAKLQPRLMRIFLQEFFAIYPAHDRFDWSKLDPYMDSFARTGAKLVAAITIKPPVLFPTVDQRVWQPNDVGEWQRVICELVRRYSVEKPIVTHWEIGNETDIGETGGAPYYIPDPQSYADFYRMTIQPILEAFPDARVGGPASCWVENQPLPGLVEYCKSTGTRLDFISWHIYDDDPARHAAGVAKAKALLENFPGRRPEMLVTEMNKGFDALSLADLAGESRRAAAIAAILLALLDTGLDWSFYYHIWDQTFYRDDFKPFFAGIDAIMTQHWNEIPHRFGLFGVNGEVRPQYFVYQMLSSMGQERISIQSDEPDLRVLAARQSSRLSALLVNYNLHSSCDRIVTLQLNNLAPGPRRLTTYRIDGQRRWDEQALELLPLETREIDTAAHYKTQLFCPADSVTMISLEDAPAPSARP